MSVNEDLAFWETEDVGLKLISATIGDLLNNQSRTSPRIYNHPEINLTISGKARNLMFRPELSKN